MNTPFKWALTFGIATAFVNFMFSFLMSMVCGIFTSPIAAGLAAYLSFRDYPIQNRRRFVAHVGLIVGGIGSLGSILGTIVAFFLIAPFIFTMTTSTEDFNSFTEIQTMVSSFGSNLLTGGVSILLGLVLTIGLCVAAAVIASKAVSIQNTSSSISTGTSAR